jgi:two-component system response regulator AtoC
MSSEIKKLLVVDDEEVIRDLLRETFLRKGYTVTTASHGKEALTKLNKEDFNLVVTDIRLPDISGMKILSESKKKYPDLGVIMITAYGSIKNAVKAMKQGAFDYITKPFNLEEMELVVDKFFSFQNLVDENAYLRSELDRKFNYENIIGNSEPMKRVFEAIRMVANSKATILIQGASGTGKELVARAIHYNSDRKHNPFITTNCAALPEGLVESELFGHEKGAFTGAYKTTKGRFELADGGTLLLDEVSEISPALQAKLLRVIQEREIERVGGGHPIPVNVRIIATTNRDLKHEVEEGNFRDDLYYRLNVVPIYLPTIAERQEDIPLLVQYFLKKYAEENKRPVKQISEKAMLALTAREWPGNVREIENTIERAIVMSGNDVQVLNIEHYMFPEIIRRSRPTQVSDLPITLREAEKSLIIQALNGNEQNRTKAAEQLGISVRTLRNKLNEYRKEGINL